jgi:signal transduction histidine kinase
MEAGLLKLEKSATNISLLIKGVVTEANVRASGYRIIANLGSKLPKVIVDAKRIRQVLDNLVDNAIKYSPVETEIVLTVKRQGPDLLISVTDHGSGIPPEELTKIFDRMYRIEQRLYSGIEGIGLGLYICQRLVEAHGGRIWAESTVGEGSTILFTLPGTTLSKKKR